MWIQASIERLGWSTYYELWARQWKSVVGRPIFLHIPPFSANRLTRSDVAGCAARDSRVQGGAPDQSIILRGRVYESSTIWILGATIDCKIGRHFLGESKELVSQKDFHQATLHPTPQNYLSHLDNCLFTLNIFCTQTLYTKHLFHNRTFTQTASCTQGHVQNSFKQNTVWSTRQLGQKSLVYTKPSSTKRLLQQYIALYTNHLYPKHLLHHKPFTPKAFYTAQLFDQKPFIPEIARESMFRQHINKSRVLQVATLFYNFNRIQICPAFYLSFEHPTPHEPAEGSFGKWHNVHNVHFSKFWASDNHEMMTVSTWAVSWAILESPS